MRNTKDSLKSMNVQTKQQRIAGLARRMPNKGIKSLNHYVDIAWMDEAYHRVRKDAAVGIDGVTWQEYGESLEENLSSLLNRFKSGNYYAPAAKRVYIPKGDNSDEQRPIDIPALEDKVLQRAVSMVLEPIFEEDFLAVSYAFRPNRKAHQALELLWKVARDTNGCWVLVIDIQKYFNSIQHDILRTFYKQRVCDGVIRRVLGKWLKAGILEEGEIRYPKEGTSQGSVISPILSNIYLHEVLDKWFEKDIKPRLSATSQLIRFADDAIILFESKQDAQRVLRVIGKRFERFGLKLHPAKTKLVYYGPPNSDSKKTETFDFLGFTHYWGRSRSGRWIPKRKTAKVRLARSIRKVYRWCKAERHKPVKQQWKTLCRKIRGHFNYYGITFNYQSISAFVYQAKCSWRKWLDRRNRERHMNWEKFNRLLERYPLPKPKIVHSYVA